jgi:hypothetical protein
MQKKFLSIIENLPESLRNQLRSDNTPNGDQNDHAHSETDLSSLKQSSIHSIFHDNKSTRIPISDFGDRSIKSSFSNNNFKQADDLVSEVDSISTFRSSNFQNISGAGNFVLQSREANKLVAKGDYKSKSSPIDQLIASILEGDVQGIRSVVRSRGESLASEFWSSISESILPLHRAISGLHFHGSDKLLISTLETLLQLGAAVNAQDHTGNTPLHKALLVCTSTSVVPVVECLLKRGASPTLKNAAGDTPLLVECRRIRTATVDVINALVASGADVNVRGKTDNGHLATPLFLVLLKAAFSLKSIATDGNFNDTNISIATGNQYEVSNSMRPDVEIGKIQNSGRKVWVKTACLLVKSGAQWEPSIELGKGVTSLYLLLKAFPPHRDNISNYKYLLGSALSAHINPSLEDSKGCNALFVFCEQMSYVSSDAFPESTSLLKMILKCMNGTIGNSDRTGRTIFDLNDDHVSFSCLSANKQLLIDFASNHASMDLNQGTSFQLQESSILSVGDKYSGRNSLFEKERNTSASDYAIDDRMQSSSSIGIPFTSVKQSNKYSSTNSSHRKNFSMNEIPNVDYIPMTNRPIAHPSSDGSVASSSKYSISSNSHYRVPR